MLLTPSSKQAQTSPPPRYGCTFQTTGKRWEKWWTRLRENMQNWKAFELKSVWKFLLWTAAVWQRFSFHWTDEWFTRQQPNKSGNLWSPNPKSSTSVWWTRIVHWGKNKKKQKQKNTMYHCSKNGWTWGMIKVWSFGSDRGTGTAAGTRWLQSNWWETLGSSGRLPASRGERHISPRMRSQMLQGECSRGLSAVSLLPKKPRSSDKEKALQTAWLSVHKLHQSAVALMCSTVKDCCSATSSRPRFPRCRLATFYCWRELSPGAASRQSWHQNKSSAAHKHFFYCSM